jgi:hypothetical protein
MLRNIRCSSSIYEKKQTGEKPRWWLSRRIRMRHSWTNYPEMDMISLGLLFKDHIHQMKELVFLLLKSSGNFVEVPGKYSMEIIFTIPR